MLGPRSGKIFSLSVRIKVVEVLSKYFLQSFSLLQYPRTYSWFSWISRYAQRRLFWFNRLGILVAARCRKRVLDRRARVSGFLKQLLHPGITGHRPARSQPTTASHSPLRSWDSSLSVATVTNIKISLSTFMMVWCLLTDVSFFLSTFGNISFLYVSSMTLLAPDHAPGPMRRYWAAQQGPKKHLKAKSGSLKKSLLRSGLQPIKSASWSLYGMLETCTIKIEKGLVEHCIFGQNRCLWQDNCLAIKMAHLWQKWSIDTICCCCWI